MVPGFRDLGFRVPRVQGCRVLGFKASSLVFRVSGRRLELTYNGY